MSRFLTWVWWRLLPFVAEWEPGWLPISQRGELLGNRYDIADRISPFLRVGKPSVVQLIPQIRFHSLEGVCSIFDIAFGPLHFHLAHGETSCRKRKTVSQEETAFTIRSLHQHELLPLGSYRLTLAANAREGSIGSISRRALICRKWSVRRAAQTR
jgi:hypothetical protein